LLERIVKEIGSKNKRLHPDEQALLLYFINKLIKKSFKMSKLKTQKLNHPFVRAYQFYSKPVIAIDEATDFHLIDLIAIHSLSDYEIFSVTYCGDLMQRLTENGLRTWDDLKNFIPKFEKKNLAVSYRQSPTLLKLAEKIYEKATNKQAEYISHLDYSEDEPKPLLFNSFDEKEKRNWIAERIIEIHRAYGDELKPSIAIFLASEDQIDDFARALGEIDRLANVGLRVKACSKGQVLGDENMIRVFSLEYIKGLEFQAVFFHNIHEALHRSNQQMMLKNIYVGLSRAAFYLGVTANEKVKELDYLENIFDAKTDWN
jgi:superfamily I DNA/RNA helicase